MLLWLHYEDIRNIGYSDSVKTGEQTTHIETIVAFGDTAEIVTKIWRGGASVDKIVTPYQPVRNDTVTQMTRAAVAQHEEFVSKVKKGDYDG